MFLSGGWGLHATFLRVVGVDQRAKRVHGVDPVFTLYSSEYADICFSFGSCPIVPLSVPTTKSSAFGNAGMSFFQSSSLSCQKALRKAVGRSTALPVRLGSALSSVRVRRSQLPRLHLSVDHMWWLHVPPRRDPQRGGGGTAKRAPT